MSLLAFVSQVIDVFAIFPQSQTLIVMPPMITTAYPMGVADEHGSNLLLYAEVYYLSRGFMAQITDAAFSTTALRVFGVLEFFPTSGIFCAMALLFGKLPKLLISLPFERTDTAPGDYQSFPCIGGNRRQMDLSQVYCRVNIARRGLGLGDFDVNMEFKPVIPDQRTGPGVFW